MNGSPTYSHVVGITPSDSTSFLRTAKLKISGIERDARSVASKLSSFAARGQLKNFLRKESRLRVSRRWPGKCMTHGRLPPTLCLKLPLKDQTFSGCSFQQDDRRVATSAHDEIEDSLPIVLAVRGRLQQFAQDSAQRQESKQADHAHQRSSRSPSCALGACRFCVSPIGFVSDHTGHVRGG